MKITKVLRLSFLLLAFIGTSFPEAVHAKDPAAVLDVFGHEVQAGARYLIVAPSTDNTTTLAVTMNGQILCNSDVILSTLNESFPITFSPVIQSTDGVIREGTHLNVNFAEPIATCFMAGVTPMWKIRFSTTAKGFIVTTGGVDRLNRFMITKSEGESTRIGSSVRGGRETGKTGHH
ncbi:PREDICTED: wound-responsive protein GWIN3-like isoform X2 [Populus euphratica]|uniref:Wound-responsive protein GWIN3-like isoform X2 n=1 Tax=Populus euphratica TaxID=75702 RepID=A0AAJ6TDH0_POPEU|nr:PREDICTED: wound-responsive protein GWIN3-like isoform X2 [Populus euphratica]